MSFYDPPFLVYKYRYRYPSDAKGPCNAVFPSDRKGDLVGLHKLPDIVITAQDKGADEFDTLAAVRLICLLKFGSLLLALRSPVSANVHHHRHPVCCLVCNCLSVYGSEAEVSDCLISVSEDRKEEDNRAHP